MRSIARSRSPRCGGLPPLGPWGDGPSAGYCRLAQWIAAASGSPAAFMLRWACELVVDRTVLVYAPPLYERIGPRLGPIRLFGDQAALWEAASKALDRPALTAASKSLRVRVFPHGGLTYVPSLFGTSSVHFPRCSL